MRGESPQGLTVQDFHPGAFINPRDVFPSKSRQSIRSGYRYSSPLKSADIPGNLKKQLTEAHRFPCCDGDDDTSRHSSTTLDCCSDLHELSGYSATSVNSGSLPHGREDGAAKSPLACDDCYDECDECIEDHMKCDDPEECLKECEECIDEHAQICGHQGEPCTETCDDCDFSCFDCVDWAAFESDKSLGLSFSVPLLGHEDEMGLDLGSEEQIIHKSLTNSMADPSLDIPVPPLDMPMHHQCLQTSAPFWNGAAEFQWCPDKMDMLNPQFNLQVSNQSQYIPGYSYGCHPAILHQQPLPPFEPPLAVQNVPLHPLPYVKSENQNTSTSQQALQAPEKPLLTTKEPVESPQNNTARVCQWLMPCGTMCSASFATTSDLKKHLKAAHVVKGTLNCSWQNCDAHFATEAALTGHISKKHLAQTGGSNTNGAKGSHDDSGPFKCTFPGCSKSFMYKQVLEEHIASSHCGSRMYCHICDTWLNGEGSNFRRHMAAHRPKHQHMLCKYHHLGCQRRFPRLDNLRRHEGCCKFGKKAAAIAASGAAGVPHHHHHHRHVERHE